MVLRRYSSICGSDKQVFELTMNKVMVFRLKLWNNKCFYCFYLMFLLLWRDLTLSVDCYTLKRVHSVERAFEMFLWKILYLQSFLIFGLTTGE